MSIIDPNSGHFPVGEGFIYSGSLYPQHIGMKSHEVYCWALGVTLPDGTVPQAGICYEINHNMVPYEINKSDNPRDIDMNGFKIVNMGLGTNTNDAATVGYVQNLYSNGVDLSEIGNPGDILTVTNEGYLEGKHPNKVFPEKAIFESTYYKGVL